MPALGLAIETSGRVGEIALSRDGVVVAERAFAHGLQHAALLVPLIAEMLAGEGVAVGGAQDVGEIYVSVGPGSFTGVRIGVTVAKTWGWVRGGSGVRIVAVPSPRVVVEGLAGLTGNVRHAVTVMDAKRGQIFSAMYERTEGPPDHWREMREAALDTLAAAVERGPWPLMLVGEGLPAHIGNVALEEGVSIASEALWAPRARHLATVGHAWGRQGRWTEAMSLVPLYVRLPEAEEKWRARG